MLRCPTGPSTKTVAAAAKAAYDATGSSSTQQAVVEGGPCRVDRQPGREPVAAIEACREERAGEVEYPPLLDAGLPRPPVQADLGGRGTAHHPPTGRPDAVEMPLHRDVPRRGQLQRHVESRVDRDRLQGDPTQPAPEVGGQRTQVADRIERRRQAQFELAAGLEADVRRRERPLRRPPQLLDRHHAAIGRSNDVLLLDRDPDRPPRPPREQTGHHRVQLPGLHGPSLIP